MGLQKGHQKAKTDEHHHIDVLEDGIALVNQLIVGLFSLHSHIKGVEYYYYYLSSNEKLTESLERVCWLLPSLVLCPCHWSISCLKLQLFYIL